MAEVDDPEERHRRAREEEEAVLAAAQVLFSFQDARLQDPPPSLEDDEGPSEAAPQPLRWGSVRKRSRHITMEGTREARRDEAAAAAAAAAKAKKKMRASPPSPLDYSGGSSASTSGGYDGSSSPEKLGAAERPRPAEPLAVRVDGPHPRKVVGSERPLEVSRVPARKSTKWSGRKKTIPELQAAEKSLMEEREKLQKEVEAWRKGHVALLAENRRLKLSLEAPRTKKDAASVASIEMKQPESSHHVALSSPVQGRGDFHLLPDLNEPLPENLD